MSISFPVSPEKQTQLLSRMQKLNIKESDLEETFTKSGGKGGQNVNKVSTAVHLKHKVSGIEIKCSIHRTQGLNRYKARAILCDKLEEKENPKESKAFIQREKIRKTKTKKEKRRQKRLEELKIQDLETEGDF
ncbi:MAG TPA: peptide chain release factor-like protein [Leptospiraceae bacterium]|nr:peptide chain release factor-like protein [Leptospiraceae bacterium]HMX31729.1 peptide chain release factor-like protein [Leptospiraceae bacterium]HMY30535.1 peptide chain release factor-like protein [Leptospiraceae bacterium]HMZ64164.1 peptide chain release factor-like protein [Leptospiraceae bacterium]HNA08728.1 peptide chain release factor-like protein [Leptospiraceae bacterium]